MRTRCRAFSFLWLSTLPAQEKWTQYALALTSIKADNLYWACELSRVWFYFAGTYTLCPTAPSPPRAQLGSRPGTSGCGGCRWRKPWWGGGQAVLWSPRFSPWASRAHREQRQLAWPSQNCVWSTEWLTGQKDDAEIKCSLKGLPQRVFEAHCAHSRSTMKYCTLCLNNNSSRWLKDTSNNVLQLHLP